MNQQGILYGISVGTGDPELITIKGLRLLQQSPIVAFPAGIKGEIGIAEKIVAPWLSANQDKLALHFPYLQDEELLLKAWQEAAKKVWEYLLRGQDVAFACEGDVSFYSTFTYLAQTLEDLHPEAIVKTVPGVSSPMAAASALRLPLTVLDQSFVVLPALYHVKDLVSFLEIADVIVLLKVKSVYEQVWKILQEQQLLSRSFVVEWATMPNQRIYQNLADYPSLQLSYFSVLIIKVRS